MRRTMKIAVIVEGTAAYEECAYAVEAENCAEALKKVATSIIKAEKESDGAAYSHDEPHNNHTPRYEMAIYNDEGGLVYTMYTMDLIELN